MTERIRVENVDELQRLSQRLQQVSERLNVQDLGSFVSSIGSSVDQIVSQFDDIKRALGGARNEEISRRLDAVEAALRGAQGAQRGVQVGLELRNQLRSLGAGSRSSSALQLALLGYGAFMGLTERGRIREARILRNASEISRRQSTEITAEALSRIDEQRAERSVYRR